MKQAKTTKSTGHVRISPGSMFLIDNLRNVMSNLHLEVVDDTPLTRRDLPRPTNAEVLHVALDTALLTLDPDHIKREPLPSPCAEGLAEADDGELVMELLAIEERASRVREVLMVRHATARSAAALNAAQGDED